MVKFIILCFLLILNGCSTLKKDVVDCPTVTAPKKAAELVVKSENKLPVYIGFRGIKSYCTKDNNNIEMEVSVNVRAIRKDTKTLFKAAISVFKPKVVLALVLKLLNQKKI